LLTRGLLAALSVEADTEAAAQDLHSVLDEAHQLLQEADGLHAQVQHTLDDADRIDARTTRASLGAEPQ
jgi:hypothetical protein